MTGSCNHTSTRNLKTNKSSSKIQHKILNSYSALILNFYITLISVWSAFERNDVNEWFKHLAFLAFTPNKGPQPKGAPLAETPKYDKKKEIREAYYEWLGVIKKYDYDYNPPVNKFKIPGITDNFQIRQGQKPATNI